MSETLASPSVKKTPKQPVPRSSKPRLIGRAGLTTWAGTPDNQKEWFVIDASEAPVGRVASLASTILMGKHKATYSTSSANGDFVVLINVKEAVFTGKKWTDKIYYWHTRYPGGIKSTTPKELIEKDPARIFHGAIRGMLPKTRLGRKMLDQLKIYPGAEHPHRAQNPRPISLSKEKTQ